MRVSKKRGTKSNVLYLNNVLSLYKRYLSFEPGNCVNEKLCFFHIFFTIIIHKLIFLVKSGFSLQLRMGERERDRQTDGRRERQTGRRTERKTETEIGVCSAYL